MGDGQKLSNDWDGWNGLFTSAGLLRVKYGETLERNDNATTDGPSHNLEVQTPLGVKITVTRWPTYIKVAIDMWPEPDGQDGTCGNFNGNPLDDSQELIAEHMDVRVLDNDLLLPRYPATKLIGEGCCKTWQNFWTLAIGRGRNA